MTSAAPAAAPATAPRTEPHRSAIPAPSTVRFVRDERFRAAVIVASVSASAATTVVLKL